MPQNEVIRWIAKLRHYARGLACCSETGDLLVVAFATHVNGQPGRIDSQLELFRLYHDWLPPDGQSISHRLSPATQLSDLDLELQQRLVRLGFLHRAMLLLVTVAEFPADEAALVLRLDTASGSALLAAAFEQAGHTHEAAVLIVENDALTAMDISAQVEELGHQVIAVAPTADRARQLVRAHRVDLVVTDLSIGGEDTGLDLVEELRAASSMPIILVTGHPERAAGLRSETRIQLVSKPFETKALQFAIMDALAARSDAKLEVG